MVSHCTMCGSLQCPIPLHLPRSRKTSPSCLGIESYFYDRYSLRIHRSNKHTITPPDSEANPSSARRTRSRCGVQQASCPWRPRTRGSRTVLPCMHSVTGRGGLKNVLQTPTTSEKPFYKTRNEGGGASSRCMTTISLLHV